METKCFGLLSNPLKRKCFKGVLSLLFFQFFCNKNLKNTKKKNYSTAFFSFQHMSILLKAFCGVRSYTNIYSSIGRAYKHTASFFSRKEDKE